jgi:outer membrane immunogenic protein
MKKFVLALAFASVSSVAFATDMPVRAPAYKAQVASSPSWSGFYGGLNAGWGWDPGSADVTTENGFTAGIFPDPKIKPSGFLGGGQLGYNAQINQLVLGIESDIDYSDINGSSDATGPTGFHVTGTERLKWFGTVRARLGVVSPQNVLFYGTGGFAFGNATVSTSEFVPGNCGPSVCSFGSTTKTLTGWTVGGGTEFVTGTNWTMKFEYLYYDLGHINNVGMDITTPGSLDLTSTTNVRGNIVRVGLNYKFGN